ncbi:MAG: YceI family protein [Bacteroidales bacterium]
MKSGLLSFFLWICVITLSAQRDYSGIWIGTSGTVNFVSEAPLELIRASSKNLKGLIDPEKRTFAFTLSTRSFKGFNSPLQQEHFYENYIETHLYPAASFEGKIIELVDLTEPGEYRIRAKGMLDIHGVTNERVIDVDVVSEGDRMIASADFDVMLEDHDITIPKMVYQKISETIRVSVRIKFEPGKQAHDRNF